MLDPALPSVLQGGHSDHVRRGGNPNPPTPAFFNDYQWVDNYLNIHKISRMSVVPCPQAPLLTRNNVIYSHQLPLRLFTLDCYRRSAPARDRSPLGRREEWLPRSAMDQAHPPSQNMAKETHPSLGIQGQATRQDGHPATLHLSLQCTTHHHFIPGRRHCGGLRRGARLYRAGHELMGLFGEYDQTQRHDDGCACPSGHCAQYDWPGLYHPKGMVDSRRADRWVCFSRGRVHPLSFVFTGIIAFALMPLCVLVALKAPPFAIVSLLTNIFSDKLGWVHRWSGRLLYLVTVVHIATWCVQLSKDHRAAPAGGIALDYVLIYDKFIYAVIVSTLLPVPARLFP